MRAIEYPEGFFYVERASLIMFGLGSQLAPKVNPFQLGFPYIAQFMASQGRQRAQG